VGDAAGAESEPVPSLARTLSAEVRSGEIGPLLGGYRPSSLRLIDEAVAAAQAVEPTLFEDAAAARPEDVRHSGNGVSRPAMPEAEPDRYQAPERADEMAVQQAMETVSLPRTSSREESGLRMIGSLGRDRAEASGELAPLGTARPRRNETARELVTILPRRSTRDLPVVPPASTPVPESPSPELEPPLAVLPAVAPIVPTQDLAASLPTPTPASPVLEPRLAAAPALDISQRPPTGPQARVSLPGSGVRAPSRSRRILRIVRSIERNGPGVGPLLLILLAVVLAGTAVLLRLRRHARANERIELVQEPVRQAAPPVAIDRASVSPDGPDGSDGSDGPDAMGASVPIDAAQSIDASPPVPDAGPRARESGAGSAAAARPNAGVDKIAEAKVLYDRAHDALEEGDFTKALELTDASLKQRRTARTYLLRAQAQQRLDRIDDALASVDAATQLAPAFGTVWELRGRILWAARRRDEARAAFEKFLELDPDSPKAPAVRRLMNEPR
jgi:hypothetical protein